MLTFMSPYSVFTTLYPRFGVYLPSNLSWSSSFCFATGGAATGSGVTSAGAGVVSAGAGVVFAAAGSTGAADAFCAASSFSRRCCRSRINLNSSARSSGDSGGLSPCAKHTRLKTRMSVMSNATRRTRLRRRVAVTRRERVDFISSPGLCLSIPWPSNQLNAARTD